jgi:hypothetical protein
MGDVLHKEMTDEELTAWNIASHQQASSYLESQGIDSPSIGDWPAFEVAPHFGIWCVESKEVEGKIGWWVFVGDCPTDYVSEDGQCHPRAALENLLVRWRAHIPYLRRGEQPPDVNFGDGSDLRDLGDLLERRVSMLEEWRQDDSLWEDQ